MCLLLGVSRWSFLSSKSSRRGSRRSSSGSSLREVTGRCLQGEPQRQGRISLGNPQTFQPHRPLPLQQEKHRKRQREDAAVSINNRNKTPSIEECSSSTKCWAVYRERETETERESNTEARKERGDTCSRKRRASAVSSGGSRLP